MLLYWGPQKRSFSIREQGWQVSHAAANGGGGEKEGFRLKMLLLVFIPYGLKPKFLDAYVPALNASL